MTVSDKFWISSSEGRLCERELFFYKISANVRPPADCRSFVAAIELLYNSAGVLPLLSIGASDALVRLASRSASAGVLQQ